MYQRDYILRMIEQMASFIGTLMQQLKNDNKPEEAIALCGEQFGRLFLPKSQLLTRLSDEDLLAMMTQQGDLDVHKALMAGILLKEEAGLYRTIGDEDASYIRYIKSLYLLLVAAEYQLEVDRMDYLRDIDDIIIKLNKYHIPANLLTKAAAYYESSGKYAQAENMHYEYSHSNEGSFMQGELFYARMLLKSDEELSAGGLPRNEVYEGMRELGTRKDF